MESAFTLQDVRHRNAAFARRTAESLVRPVGGATVPGNHFDRYTPQR
ncbi:MAG: hypothetical protein WBV69_22795 [Candidatus Sulfotelmatobacter sp.]